MRSQLRSTANRIGPSRHGRSFGALLHWIMVRAGLRLADGRRLSLHRGEAQGFWRRHSGELGEGREVAWVRNISFPDHEGVAFGELAGAANLRQPAGCEKRGECS